jgi:hypothetical protein
VLGPSGAISKEGVRRLICYFEEPRGGGALKGLAAGPLRTFRILFGTRHTGDAKPGKKPVY